ncbi:MAG TPA: DJ-1/PfpI family protein, partial [Gemmata sp.]|nr:DJ-1/PfpI family protein [Gemmata sp.]
PGWQQTWTMIAAAAVGVIVIVAIAVAALGKKDRDGSSDGNSASRGGSPIGGGATPRGGENPNGQVNGEIRPVLYVVPSRGVWKNDYLPVKKRLEDRGVKVVTASGDGGAALVHDGNGETINVDKRLDEVKAAEYSGIVFGGFRIDEYIAGGPHSAQAGRLIDNFREQKKPVSAICIGLGVLVSHDVLKGKRAAKSFALKEHYPRLEGGVAWVSEDVVTAQDGPEGSSKLITAAGPEHASSFATALLKALGER